MISFIRVPSGDWLATELLLPAVVAGDLWSTLGVILLFVSWSSR
jgi:hypothetical protein